MKLASILPKITIVSAASCWVICLAFSIPAAESRADQRKIPVILDTDIGDDIDDTWALVLLLKSPELDIKLVVGDYNKPIYRASLIAKLLETAKRTDIDVGIGSGKRSEDGERQSEWLADYAIASYPGTVHEDGVQAIIDTIMESPEPITLIAIGPVPNIRAALEREPRIAEKASFVGMHGSVRRGYGGSADISAEWNVKADPAACQQVLSAPWDITITPLDTCGLIHLRGEKYAAVRDCQDPLIRALIANYRCWWKNQPRQAVEPERAELASSTLFDTVAVYLASSHKLCTLETLPIRVTDDGLTVIDPSAKKMQVATAWKNMAAFEDFLVNRLTGKQ